MVFFDDSTVLENRTPGNAGVLEGLGRPLGSMGISNTPKAKFERFCSAMCRAYLGEPPKVAKKPPFRTG